MPTPRPIIVATELAQSGTSMTLASSAPPARPTPTPNSAVASGSPIATSDPNAISRTIAAMSRPGPSAPMLPDWALSIAWPASSICVPAAPGVGGEVDHLGRDVDREAGARAVELHGRVAGRPVAGDLAGAVGIPRRGDGDDVGQLADPLDEWFGDGANVGRGHAGVVVDDDRDGVAGLGRESLVEQLDGGLRVGAGRQEVLLVLAAERSSPRG